MRCIECGSVRHFEECLHLMQCPCYDNELTDPDEHDTSSNGLSSGDESVLDDD